MRGLPHWGGGCDNTSAWPPSPAATAAAAPKDGMVKPAIGTAMLLTVYADALGDAALKADAIKVAEAVIAKDYNGANEIAKKMAVKPGAAAGKGDLPKFAKFEADKV